MSRGRTRKGRSRAGRLSPRLPPARPLLRAVDHGEPVRLDGATVGAAGDRWVEPFLHANGALLSRLQIRPEVRVHDGVHVSLHPGSRVGAVPLLSPSTRRVVAGLLVAPRFRWTALGAVFGAIGFGVEPGLGGAPLVPGSAREVPPWLLAGPVLNRIEGLLAHRRRGFIERTEYRSSPRGRVDWSAWARRDVPTGRWSRLPCRFSDPDDDPSLLASVRWTLARLDEDLARLADSVPARMLRSRIEGMEAVVGPGEARRPAGNETLGAPSGWIVDAQQAMGWVAEERGLGGARTLDGLAWHLSVDEVWEAWVDAFVQALAPRLGMVAIPRGETRRGLNWGNGPGSMGSLVPDTGLRSASRAVWIDAKYKAHLHLLARHGWSGLAAAVRDAHRADLHQALAYAALADVDRVDTVLAYPLLGADQDRAPAIATVTSGRRHVRLVLAGIPFGFRTPEQQEQALGRWRAMLAA